jgi:hypothetical protein
MKIVIVLFAVLLAGCATILPVRGSEDECLVIIRTVIDNPEKVVEARSVLFLFSNGAPAVRIPKHASYVALVVNEPGVQISAVRSAVDSNMGYVGAPSDYPVDVPLPYVPGGIAITPWTFTQKFFKKDGTQYSGWDFAPLTPADRDEIEALLKERENYDSWSRGSGKIE